MKFETTTFDQLLDKEKCINLFVRYGYYIHNEDDHALVLRKPGTVFTWSIENMPLELSVSFQNSGTEVSLNYDTFVLFDTGDLKKELDRLSSIIANNMNTLI